MNAESPKKQVNFLSQRFESLVENGLDCVLIFSEEVKPIYVSKSVKKIMGYTPEEVMEMDIMAHIHPDDVAGGQEVILKALNNPGVPIKGHTSRMKHKNGSWVWIDAVVTNMLHDPNINGIVDNFRDITEQVLAKESLNESSQRLLMATQTAKIGIWEYDITQKQLIWDDIMFELYGIVDRPIPFTYETWISLIHSDDQAFLMLQSEELIKESAEFSIEYRIVRPDGSIKYIKSIGQFQKDSDGNPIRLIGTNWDITASRKAKEKFRNLLETAPDAMVIINENNLIELINTETERMFGYTKLELIGKPVEILLPKSNRKNPFLVKNHPMVYTQTTVRGETSDLFAIKKDGHKFPVEINIGTLNTGDELLTSAAIRDISSRKKTEKMLRNMAAIKAKNEEMEELAYITSHDLREPLLTLKRYSQVLQEQFGTTLKDEGKILLDTIIQSADRMESRINSLLDYSQLGQVKELEPVDCNKILEIVIEDLNSLIESKNAQVHVGSLPSAIKAYPTELQLIFQNLINNAIKFTEKDSTPIVHIACLKNGESYEFQVSDNGIGIAKKHHKKIFSIFQKLNRSVFYQGAGIGLAQVKKLVELHNGRIWLRSEPTKGSTFSFTINTENL